MTVNDIIKAVSLIQDMEDAKKARNVIKDYSIEFVTESWEPNTISMQVHETALISSTPFYFVNLEKNFVKDACNYIVFPE